MRRASSGPEARRTGGPGCSLSFPTFVRFERALDAELLDVVDLVERFLLVPPEASLDDFAHLHYTTLDGGRILPEPSFAVPESAWSLVPPGATCHWRGVVIWPDRREVVARGSFVRDANGA